MGFKTTLEDAALAAHSLSVDNFMATYHHEVKGMENVHAFHPMGVQQSMVYFDPKQLIIVDSEGVTTFKDNQGQEHQLVLYMSRPLTAEDIAVAGGDIVE